jgi:hypothetical protein
MPPNGESEGGESFEACRRSFSYGSRTDLSFKFLAGLSDGQAADFLQELLRRVVAAIDCDTVELLSDHLIAGQATAYADGGRWAYDEGPFASPAGPVSELRLGLLTSSGHFIAGDDPQPLGVAEMTQEEAIRRIAEFGRLRPELSEIPFGTPPTRLRVRHGGYDVRGAQADPEVMLPLATLTGLAREGLIGDLPPSAYSFVGVTAQRPLIDRIGPAWVKRFREERIGAMLLVPA